MKYFYSVTWHQKNLHYSQPQTEWVQINSSVKTFQLSLCYRNYPLNFCHHSNVHVCISLVGEHESVLPASMVNAVLINKHVRRSKSFTEHVPVRKIRLEMTSSGNAQDSSPWRTHLGIHRLVQAPCQGVSWDLSHCKNRPHSFDNQRLISKGNGMLQHKELEGASELSMLSQLGSSNTLNSFSEENGSNISSTCQEPPPKSATSAVWTHQHISSTKCMPACNKLNFYPFPNKKGPRISEAARRLGLYVSQWRHSTIHKT